LRAMYFDSGERKFNIDFTDCEQNYFKFGLTYRFLGLNAGGAIGVPTIDSVTDEIKLFT
jgi:hypothetical protein